MENNEKFKGLMDWFDFMNEQFEKIEEANNNSKINSMLIDNDIDLID